MDSSSTNVTRGNSRRGRDIRRAVEITLSSDRQPAEQVALASPCRASEENIAAAICQLKHLALPG